MNHRFEAVHENQMEYRIVYVHLASGMDGWVEDRCGLIAPFLCEPARW
jgi:hypothetical protein